ncbi:MAG: hypothetical protein PHF17_08110 [Arcobacteraceae bacterium]|jgi:hypothetical protein|nr:hypothetical protein [Arcobacteraceae bacterium]
MCGITKLPIQASFLLSTNKTLKDIKTEILLTFVSQLFDEYNKIKNNDYDEKKSVITVQTPEKNDIAIDTVVSELSLYCNENAITKEQLFKIFGNANLNKQSFIIAKQYEPLGVYYEKLSTLLKNYIPNGGLFMPEYLGLLLIHYYTVEAGQSFGKFPFIKDYNLNEILAVYGEVNINIKKELVEKHPSSRIWEHRTVFDTMEKVAIKIIKEYHTFQYKVNINRVSKTRKKK